MRCDGKKPRCLHCVAYAVDCTYAAPSRKSTSRKIRGIAKSISGIIVASEPISALGSVSPQYSQPQSVVQQSLSLESVHRHNTLTSSTSTSLAAKSTNENITKPRDPLMLPKTEDILPVVDSYIKDINSICPLFNASVLKRIAYDCINKAPSDRDTLDWAAIQVVLGLTARYHLPITTKVPSSLGSKIRSVLPDIISENIQLLHIQVLLGVVMLLQAQQDLKAASILIATTIRLAHSIGLHDAIFSSLTADEAKQRASVFWLAYILDKDLSMRQKQPSIQADDDINLDIASLGAARWDNKEAKDHAGTIITKDGMIKMDYLAVRVQLAAIQGAVYDYIYSTRSRNRTPAERSHALQSVSDALEDWKASIPSEFSALSTPGKIAPTALRFLGALHATSLACTTLIHRAHAWDVEWVSSLNRYSLQGIPPKMPTIWDTLVVEARGLLVLYSAVGTMDDWDLW